MKKLLILLLLSTNIYASTWEKISENTWRMQTPQGWIVATHSGITYVPDEKHKWKIG